jgi:hypothetical protein
MVYHLIPREPEAAMGRMLGTTQIPRNQKSIGVYWESYGFGARDTVEVGLRIQRRTGQGLLATVGMALNVLEDKNAPVFVSWTEPNAAHSTFTVNGISTIVARAIALDISALPAGEYWLDAAVRKPGGVAATSRRALIIGEGRGGDRYALTSCA